MKTPFCALAPPLALFLFLRFFVHSILRIELGYRFGTDFDFVPQMIFAFLAFVWAFQAGEKTKLALQKDALGYLSVFLIAFFAMSVSFRPLLSFQHVLVISIWFALVFLVLLSSFFLFLRPAFYWRLALIPALLAGFSGLLLNTVCYFVWKPMARVTGMVTFNLLKPFLPSLRFTLKHLNGPDGIREFSSISYPSLFCMGIGRGCGGAEGIALFAFLLGLFAVVDKNHFRGKNLALLGTLGIFLMFFLNIARLLVLFIVGLLTSKYWGSVTAPVVSLMHTWLGWVFYGGGLGLFFYGVLRGPRHVASLKLSHEMG